LRAEAVQRAAVGEFKDFIKVRLGRFRTVERARIQPEQLEIVLRWATRVREPREVRIVARRQHSGII
jgi:hypothetical protein